MYLLLLNKLVLLMLTIQVTVSVASGIHVNSEGQAFSQNEPGQNLKIGVSEMYIKQEILRLSNDIDETSQKLQEIEETMLDLVTSKNTNRPIRSSENTLNITRFFYVTCNINQELKHFINTTLLNSSLSSNCDLSSLSNLSSDSDECEKLVKLMEYRVNHLSKGFQMAIVNNVSLNELSVLQNEFLQLYSTYKKYLDKVKVFFPRDILQRVNTLEINLQTTTQLINRWMKNLKLKTKYLCVLQILTGEVSAAILNYEELASDDDDLSDVDEIIQAAYSSIKSDNITDIMDFISALPSTHCIEGFNSLYEEMEKQGHLSSPKVLLFAEMENKNSCSSNELKQKVRRFANNFVGLWANKVRSNDFTQIREFSKNYLKCSLSFIGQVVKYAYSRKISNVEVVLKFIRDLPYIEQKGVGCSSLFDAMKVSGHLNGYRVNMLAYVVKEQMESSQYLDMDDFNKKKFDYLKENLPSSVRSLVWNGGNCTIENLQHGEILYAALDNFNFDVNQRKVFTWVPKNAENIQFWWKLDTENGGKTFTIKHKVFNEYLISSTNEVKDELRRWAFTWIPKLRIPEDSWQLEYVDTRDSFYILNSHNKEYLYAEGDVSYGYSSERRGVFTWRIKKPVPLLESLWKISC